MISATGSPGPFSEKERTQVREKFRSLFLQWGSLILLRPPPGDVKKIVNAWVKWLLWVISNLLSTLQANIAEMNGQRFYIECST